jgi:hypothetical protein
MGRNELAARVSCQCTGSLLLEAFFADDVEAEGAIFIA